MLARSFVQHGIFLSKETNPEKEDEMQLTEQPVTPSMITAAARRIAPYIRNTPTLVLETGALASPARITLKLEQTQVAGSFKARGAFNRILSATVPEAGVIAASGGNHGAAVAYAAMRLGYRAEIFVPEVSSPAKIARLRDYRAAVTITGASYAEALIASQARATETGALVVHAYDMPEVVAGQGTLGRELAEQAPDLDTILVAVGGGGLIAGIAAWYAGKTRIIAIEPETCPTLYNARRAGRPVDITPGGVAMDALGAQRIGDIPFAITSAYVADSILVTDDAIRAAQQRLWNDLRLVAEPSGATALGAILAGAYRPADGERVGIVLCGANITLPSFH